jgi:hypothetical protein
MPRQFPAPICSIAPAFCRFPADAFVRSRQHHAHAATLQIRDHLLQGKIYFPNADNAADPQSIQPDQDPTRLGSDFIK